MTEQDRVNVERLIEECSIQIAFAESPAQAARIMGLRRALQRQLRPWWLRWLP